MSSDKDSFEDRLRRIRETRAEASPAGGPGRGQMPDYPPKWGSPQRRRLGH